MKLELPDDNSTVLYHMGTALRSIAVDTGYVATETPPVKVGTGAVLDGDKGKKGCRDCDGSGEFYQIEDTLYHCVTETPPVVTETPPVVTETPPVVAETPPVVAETPPVVTETNDAIDVNGLPWDQRIHSRGKTRNADDTWRNARKPKDKTDEEWTAYVEEIETELKALMEIPVASGESLDELAVADTVSAEQAFSTPPVVTETPPVVTETPPVVTETPPVVTETPPVVTETPPVVTEPSVKTFPELMKFITSNNKVLNKDIVNVVLSENGLASITLLAARAELIPQIHAALLKVVNP